jgi:GAF domain-containing protein
VPVVVLDLAELRWPLYRPVMLAQNIRSVSALPVMLAGECVGALDLFGTHPGRVQGERLAAARLAAELAELPLLDLLDEEVRSAISDRDGARWSALRHVVRAEIAQATGMLTAQMNVGPAEALGRLRAHAYATSTSATPVARAIIDRRLRLDEH